MGINLMLCSVVSPFSENIPPDELNSDIGLIFDQQVTMAQSID